VQERSGPAPDVEHRRRRHHQGQVEVEVAPPGAERVVQRGETRLRELTIDHPVSLPSRAGHHDRIWVTARSEKGDGSRRPSRPRRRLHVDRRIEGASATFSD
jgi:hypothetical protein